MVLSTRKLAMTKQIHLSDLTRGGEVRNLSGHERGLEARRYFSLDDADATGEPVEVVVPDEVYTLTPSFFQGMFSKSVHAVGGDREKFFAHFHFKASALILRQIERGVASVRSLRENPLSA